MTSLGNAATSAPREAAQIAPASLSSPSTISLPDAPRDQRVVHFATETSFWAYMGLVAYAIVSWSTVALVGAAASLLLYIAVLRVLHRLVHSGSFGADGRLRSEPPAPLAAIRPTRRDRVLYALAKVPVQNLRFLKFLVVGLPLSLLRVSASYARASGFQSDIVDEDCWSLFVASACLIPARLSHDGVFLDFESPGDLPLRTPQGVSFAGVSIRFEIATHRLVHCYLEGQDIANDKERVAGMIHSLVIGWCHTKSHLASELAAREIRAERVRAVEPSTSFTFSLHEGLVYTDNGPLRTDTQTGVVGASIYQSAFVPMAHKLDQRKQQFPYYEYLFKSRAIVLRLVEKHELPISGELLFNAVVVHSIDHINGFKWQRDKVWSLDLSKSFWSRVKSAWFANYYTQPMSNPFYSEYLRDAKHPFYRELYSALSELDKAQADTLLLSTSY